MEGRNWTSLMDFILLRLSDHPNEQTGLFVLVVCMYLTALMGNAIIVAVIIADPHLHTPMYFFLGNLSFVDACCISVTVPKMLQNMLSKTSAISFCGCMSQLYFLLITVSMEGYLLTVMGFDRYVAICYPLRYSSHMTRGLCTSLVAVSWFITSLHSLLYVCIVMNFQFCASNLIKNFFCDLPPLLKLSCSDASVYDWLLFTEGSIVTMCPFVFIVVSYSFIIYRIVMMNSVEGKLRPFSTCSSHLTAVTLYFGTIFFNYFRPSSGNSLNQERVATVVYTIVTPMLNPFIYSLRNDNVKAALRKLFGRKPCV